MKWQLFTTQIKCLIFGAVNSIFISIHTIFVASPLWNILLNKDISLPLQYKCNGNLQQLVFGFFPFQILFMNRSTRLVNEDFYYDFFKMHVFKIKKITLTCLSSYFESGYYLCFRFIYKILPLNIQQVIVNGRILIMTKTYPFRTFHFMPCYKTKQIPISVFCFEPHVQHMTKSLKSILFATNYPRQLYI